MSEWNSRSLHHQHHHHHQTWQIPGSWGLFYHNQKPISLLWLSRSVVATDMLVECYLDLNKFMNQMSARRKATIEDTMCLHVFGTIYLDRLSDLLTSLPQKLSFVITYATKKIIDCILNAEDFVFNGNLIVGAEWVVFWMFVH